MFILPILEVVKDNINGFLVDFFAPDQFADRIEYCLDNRSKLQHIRTAARKTIIENYELRDCLQKQLELINRAKYST